MTTHTPTTAATPERMRIDELAHESGIASGTIRFYQREGLIPPPEREGRVAYYRLEHLGLLERVRSLQAHGLPLALIRDLLRREEAGEDVASWLELDSAVFSPGHVTERARAADLERAGLRGADLDGLVRAGLLTAREDGDFDAVPGTLELTRQLIEAGVEPSTFRSGAELVAERLRTVADALGDLGWGLFEAERERIESDEPVAPEVLAKLERLRALAHRIVTNLFPVMLDDAIRERSEPYALEVVSRRSEHSARPAREHDSPTER